MVQIAESETEKEYFFALAGKLSEAIDPAERQRMKAELARMTFGERHKNRREILRRLR